MQNLKEKKNFRTWHHTMEGDRGCSLGKNHRKRGEFSTFKNPITSQPKIQFNKQKACRKGGEDPKTNHNPVSDTEIPIHQRNTGKDNWSKDKTIKRATITHSDIKGKKKGRRKADS